MDDSKIPKETVPGKFEKFELRCSNSKCRYKKSLKKKRLSEKDLTCPRCKKKMKARNL